MKTIPISELRANLMKVIQNIEQGASFYVTSRGKIVAKLVPPDNSKYAEEKLNQVRKTAKIHDVISPVYEQWEGDKNSHS